MLLSRSAALCLASIVAIGAGAGANTLSLARDGRTPYVIVVDPSATSAEAHAATELAAILQQVTGAAFPVRHTVLMPAGPAIFVGVGVRAKRLAPDLDVNSLKPDGIAIQTVGPHLILAGPRPRGTLYAVYSFLEDAVGCRWWSSKVSRIPRNADLRVPAQHVRYAPPLEYREPFWTDAFDGDWAVRNKANGASARLDAVRGGKFSYGNYFVHTFLPLVPPEVHFKTHPEWYSEIGGKRLGGNGEYVQLCVTNEELKRFVADKVIAYLRDHPEVNIVSVSQSDTDNHCQCANCARLEQEEGSPAGPLLHFVNYVAAAVAKEFPEVAIDTLAYQYTRKPPLHVRPLPNVIVRLCSIECDFAHPLTAESNAKFAEDIRGWSKICNRLYIWDYVTDFSNYIQPHPNQRVLGPNVRFFVDNGVRGVFEQGAYTSVGAEFAELKAWVLAKLLWNPRLDDQKLAAEFVEGYYGAAAPQIMEYIRLIHDEAEARNTYLTCFNPTSADFLNLTLLGKAEKLMREAEAAAQGDPELLQRVQVARLPIRWVWFRRWFELQDQAQREKVAWPGPADYTENLKTFLQVARDYGVTQLREGGSMEDFAERVLGLGREAPTPPAEVAGLPRDKWLDFQDSSFSIASEGTWATAAHDDLASDKVAVRLAGNHIEWAIQQTMLGKVLDPRATYEVYISARVEKTGNEGGAFNAGVYDTNSKAYLGRLDVSAAEVADGAYHTYRIGTTPLHPQVYFWAAPTNNPANVAGIWVDRFWVVKQ